MANYKRKEREPSGKDPRRGLPQYPDLERVFLSAILKKPSIFPQVEPILMPHAFASEMHQNIWLGYCNLSMAKQQIDPVNLSAYLISEGVIERPEGSEDRFVAPYIIALQDVAYTTEFDYFDFANRIRNYAAIREVYNSCLISIDDCFDGTSAEEIRTDLLSRLTKINTAVAHGIYDMNEVDSEFYARLIEPKEAKKGRIIDTGFRSIDRAIQGINEKSVNAIVAYQKVGKSTMALQWVMYDAATTSNANLYFLLEMDRLLLYRRLVQHISGVKLKDIFRGNREATPNEMALIEEARQTLRQRNLHIIDKNCNSIASIKAHVYQFMAKNPNKKLGWICIDHWNLLDTSHGRNQTEGQEINAAEIANLAGDTGARILIPAQCSKPDKKNEKDAPSKFDVRGSSALLDIVENLITIHRPNMGTGATGSPETAQVTIEASRDSDGGSKTPINISYVGDHLGFYDTLPSSFYHIGKAGKEYQTSFWKSEELNY